MDDRKRRTGKLGREPVFFVGLLAALALGGLAVTRLSVPDGPLVVVYTALDEEFSGPIFARFTAQTGIRVLAKFDTESTKSVGLTQALLAERARPRCDVFWNNEIVNTLRLDRAGLLGEYASPAAADFPTQFRDEANHWFGFAARARVFLVNTELVEAQSRPKSITDLCDPQWKDRVGIAKPLAGTTASHAACLFAVWGQERAEQFFRRLKAIVRIMGGNKQVAQAVGRGELAWGLTDTDDALVEIEMGSPVVIVYPDQGADELGTLFIPNTVAIIRGAPHRESAEKLVDFLLSAEVEEALAAGPSGQIPLRPGVKKSDRVESPATVRAMDVDFSQAAEAWNAAAHSLRSIFTSAE